MFRPISFCLNFWLLFVKLSLEGDSEPLSKTAINTRLLVRAFHDDFTNQVVIVADSIRKTSQDMEVQKKAIQWKINTNKASTKAADVLIHEAQYTPEELPKFRGWGHSSWVQAIEVVK